MKLIVDKALLNNRRKKALVITRILAAHYGNPRWRKPLPPLDELISTILSQNTNDHNRDAAFNNLKQLYPTWEEVRDAPRVQVINAIRTAGLANQKGPRIQKVLKEITSERGCLDLDFLKGFEPEEAREWLMRFKGVGPKTAAIVLCFSLDMPAFPVDTHIYRVTGRLQLRDPGLDVVKTHQYLEQVFPEDEYYSAHLNLIRLGRERCHPRKPECPACPLKMICPAYLISNGTPGSSKGDKQEHDA
jgi:endonuclease-3